MRLIYNMRVHRSLDLGGKSFLKPHLLRVKCGRVACSSEVIAGRWCPHIPSFNHAPQLQQGAKQGKRKASTNRKSNQQPQDKRCPFGPTCAALVYQNTAPRARRKGECAFVQSAFFRSEQHQVQRRGWPCPSGSAGSPQSGQTALTEGSAVLPAEPANDNFGAPFVPSRSWSSRALFFVDTSLIPWLFCPDSAEKDEEHEEEEKEEEDEDDDDDDDDDDGGPLSPVSEAWAWAKSANKCTRLLLFKYQGCTRDNAAYSTNTKQETNTMRRDMAAL
jgi:hypothetical protein